MSVDDIIINEQSDAELVQRFARDGVSAAFDTLHERHHARLCAGLRRGGLGEADAADVAQDVFVRAFRSAGQFDPARGTFTGWLAAIARNCVARHFSRRGLEKPVDIHVLADTLEGSQDGPGDSLASGEEIAAVEDCVRHLPGELRRIVELRYAGAQTTRTIAAMMGMSEASVRNRLAEAKELLARCLGGKGVL